MKNNFDFASAMHVVSNGGMVSRECWDGNFVIKSDEIGNVCYFDIQDGELIVDELFVPDIYIIKANDWCLVDESIIARSKLDKRTEDEIQFDELMVELREIIVEMLELHNIDEERANIVESLATLIENEEDICEDCKTKPMVYDGTIADLLELLANG